MHCLFAAVDGQIFKLVTQRLFTLPDDTLVYPGHDYRGHTVSTIKEQKMRQVQIVAGSLVLLGTLLGAFVSPWFLILSGLVGAELNLRESQETER
jgi:glyoxylase-like metal-dependent hydrolase (beta-lactamase superfamily II)